MRLRPPHKEKKGGRKEREGREGQKNHMVKANLNYTLRSSWTILARSCLKKEGKRKRKKKRKRERTRERGRGKQGGQAASHIAAENVK